MQIIRKIIKVANQFWYDLSKQTYNEPPNEKSLNVILKYANDNPQCTTFIETGSWFGAIPFALQTYFKILYTIEIDGWLYEKTRKRLRNVNNVFCFHGDSADVIPALLPTVHEPILYWLDAHYSRGVSGIGNEDTPILKELDAIFSHEFILDSVVIIDDADCYGSLDEYPVVNTILEHMVRQMKENAVCMSIDVNTIDNIIVVKRK
jgi:hypothetical protein